MWRDKLSRRHMQPRLKPGGLEREFNTVRHHLVHGLGVWIVPRREALVQFVSGPRKTQGSVDERHRLKSQEYSPA